tara:strand:+ start:1389 stop:1685 length:297 start_codon:yes stop_codon:yes gene_type:complete
MTKHYRSGLLGRDVEKALHAGGKIIFARIVQHPNGSWFINIIGDWTDGQEVSLALYDRMRVRLFKRLGTCLSTVMKTLDYSGPIQIVPVEGKQAQTII